MRKTVTLAAVAILSTFTLFAQQDRQFVTGIFQPEMFNPAYRFDSRLLDLSAVYALPYAKLGNDNINLNAHSNFCRNMGIGLRFDYATPSVARDEMTAGLSYDYRINAGDGLDISLAAGGGVRYDIYIPGYDNSLKGYGEVAAAVRWKNLRAGITAFSDISGTPDLDFIATARYDFEIGAMSTVSPVVAFRYEYATFDAGVMYGYGDLFEAGAAYSSISRINIHASLRATKYFRIFYTASVALSESQSGLAPLKNEIGLRFYL